MFGIGLLTGPNLSMPTPSVGNLYDIQVSDGAGGFYGDDTAKWDYSTNTMTLGVEDSITTIRGADITGSGSGNGISVRLSPGLPAGGDPGIVSIYDPVNGFDAFLVPDPSASFTYQFPRKDGTFAMTSDIPATGANTALSNLSGVAVNASLIAGSDNAIDLGSSSIRYRASYVNNGNFIASTGSVTVPAFSGASGTNWTFGAGWTTPITGSTLDKGAAGTGTMTPSGTFTIAAGTTYKVVIVVANSPTTGTFVGNCTYTLGGVVGSTINAVGTYTDYITAGTTGKIIFTPDNGSRFGITSITVTSFTDNTGDLLVEGNLNVRSPANFNAPIKMVNTNAVAYSNNGSNWFVGGAGGTLTHSTGAFANVGIGVNVLSNAGIGAANCAVGGNALGQGLTGHDNLAFGAYAGWFTTGGSDSCFFGSSAGVVNKTGLRNTWIGREAGGTNDSTYYGTAIGYQAAGGFGAAALALGSATSGLVCIGALSGRDLTSGGYNTMVGYNTGRGPTTGTGNTVIGAQVTGLATGLTNNIILASGTGAIKAQHDGTDWTLTGKVTATGTILPRAGTTGAGTSPIKLTSGTNMTAAEAGAIEFTTDDLFFTITTGTARKAFILDDGTRLTSGRVPFATTNGRLVDDADMTFATDTLTVTKVSTGTLISTGVVRLKNYTVATLPAGTQGDRAYVTDATAPTYLGALTGGGAVVCPVFYNGAAWVSC